MSLTPATQQAQSVTLESKTPHMTPSNSGDTLTTQMKSVGETMAIGSTFKESFQKALRGVEHRIHVAESRLVRLFARQVVAELLQLPVRFVILSFGLSFFFFSATGVHQRPSSSGQPLRARG